MWHSIRQTLPVGDSVYINGKISIIVPLRRSAVSQVGVYCQDNIFFLNVCSKTGKHFYNVKCYNYIMFKHFYNFKNKINNLVYIAVPQEMLFFIIESYANRQLTRKHVQTH